VQTVGRRANGLIKSSSSAPKVSIPPDAEPASKTTAGLPEP
jgi:hypothetical protein